MSSTEQTIVLRGQEHVLRAFSAEQVIEWMSLLAECGKVIARVMGASDIEEDDIRALVLAGVELAGQALGDREFAASLAEDERRLVIDVQDSLNRAEALIPLLALQKSAAAAYLGKVNG